MKHAEKLIERLLFLDAHAEDGIPGPERRRQNVKAQLEADLKLEENAVAMYNKAIQVSREAGDDASRELFSILLKDEEMHVDWLEAQLHQIKEMGYERYLSNQTEGSEAIETRRQGLLRPARPTVIATDAANGVRDRAALLGARRQLLQLGLVDALRALRRSP